MLRLTILAVAVLTCSAGLSRGAEEPDETAKLRAEMQRLNQRIQTMEERTRLFDGGDSWVDRISFGGDFRYRWEMIKEDPAGGDETTRHRNRIRARVGMNAQVNEEFSFTLRLATGESGDPVSTNQSLDGGFSKKYFQLDSAYVTYKPEVLKDYGVAISLGKLGNPFFQPADLIWDGDLTFEGGSAQAKFKIDPVEVFVNAGLYCVEERSGDPETLLSGLQLGVNVPIGDTGIKVSAAVAGYWYGFIKEQGFIYSGTDGHGNTELGATNTYEYGYELINGSLKVDFKLAEIPLSVYMDFVQNTDADEEETGWLAGFQAGKLKDQWNWTLGYNYRVLEKDAVVGLFTDSDFGGGRTNTEGHKFSAGLRLFKNVDLGFAYMICTNNIASGEDEDDYQRMQLDISFKF